MRGQARPDEYRSREGGEGRREGVRDREGKLEIRRVKREKELSGREEIREKR